MTMPCGVSRALYFGNGQAQDFPFQFKVWDADQLSVLLTSPQGISEPAKGWTVELDETGGTVRYLHQGAALPAGWKLAITRKMPFTQDVSLISGTRFDPEVIETALDMATAERQQLLELLGRAVLVEATSECGPDALLASICNARDLSVSSAANAAKSEVAAATSEMAAAQSALTATEAREATAAFAEESLAARDVALLQTETVNNLMAVELAKVNALLASNRTDQQAAIDAARAWSEKAMNAPVEYDADGNPRYSARHWADKAQVNATEPPTATRRGSIRVGSGLALETGADGVADVLSVKPGSGLGLDAENQLEVKADPATLAISSQGALTALGGNLAYNEEVWILASGTFTAPVTGWYDVLTFDGGGNGAVYVINSTVVRLEIGNSGSMRGGTVHLCQGEEIEVVIGAGAPSGELRQPAKDGGATSFGGKTLAHLGRVRCDIKTYPVGIAYDRYHMSGIGLDGGYPSQSGATQAEKNKNCSASGHFGGCGAVHYNTTANYGLGAGAQGSVRLRYWNPDKANG